MAESTAEIDAAWTTFVERIRAAGELVTGPDFPDDPRLRAEGYRYVMRLAAQAHYLFVEFGDTVRPTLFPRGGDVFAYGATNVDNNNSRCMVDPAGVYRVSGDVRGVSELIASVYEGEFVLGQPGVLAEVKLSDLHVGENGTVELFLGGPERPANWMPLPSDASYFGVRQFILDWELDPIATLHIERIDLAEPAGNLSPASLAIALDEAATWIEANVRVWNTYSTQAAAHTPVNAFKTPAFAEGGAEAMVHGGCLWNLAPDEALVVELEPAGAGYWSVQNYVLHWLQPLDFVDRVTSLNPAQVHVDVDGRVRIVLTHRDPGVQNWLDTSGLQEGLCSGRWIEPATLPTITATLVAFADVPRRPPVVHAGVLDGRPRRATRRPASRSQPPVPPLAVGRYERRGTTPGGSTGSASDDAALADSTTASRTKRRTFEDVMVKTWERCVQQMLGRSQCSQST